MPARRCEVKWVNQYKQMIKERNELAEQAPVGLGAHKISVCCWLADLSDVLLVWFGSVSFGTVEISFVVSLSES